jgi:hypothetical protein
VLYGDAATGEVDGAVTDGFQFVVESYNPSSPQSGSDVLPRGTGAARFAVIPTWTWPTWEVPQWHSEIKPLFGAMKRAFDGIPEHPRAH